MQQSNTSELPEAKCPRCGKLRSEWRAYNSEGVQKDGRTYCCDGCAEGTECTCTMLQTAPRLERNIDPSRP